MSFIGIALASTGIYLAVGLLFSVPFVLTGVGRVDPHAAQATWGFRILIIPGTAFLWPLLAWRWLSGQYGPPTERNAHRCAARAAQTTNPESPIP